MFNNFTCENEYQTYNIIIPKTPTRGDLLLGDFNSATDPEILHKNNVKTVITAATGLEHLEIPKFVTHIVYALQDAKSENIRKYFDESFRTIDQKLNEGGVLVHCAAGVSRSATLVIAYLMKEKKIGFKDAIGIVKNKRPGICPNLGFEMQLKKYETEIIKSHTGESKILRTQMPEKKTEKIIKVPQMKKIENVSMFDFQPSPYLFKTKFESKKPITRQTGYSKPREKQMYDVAQTELFVSGKSAQRPASQTRTGDDKFRSGRNDYLMGTWAPTSHKNHHFEF